MEALAVVKLILNRGPTGGPNIDLACDGAPDLALVIGMLDSVSANLKKQALMSAVQNITVAGGPIDLSRLRNGGG